MSRGILPDTAAAKARKHRVVTVQIQVIFIGAIWGSSLRSKEQCHKHHTSHLDSNLTKLHLTTQGKPQRV